VLSWVVAVEVPNGEDVAITTTAINERQPVRARVKLFTAVSAADLSRQLRGKPGGNKVWTPSRLLNLNSFSIVFIPVHLVELDACIVGHPQEVAREEGFCVVTAVRYHD
jgi:hypothetical protein